MESRSGRWAELATLKRRPGNVEQDDMRLRCGALTSPHSLSTSAPPCSTVFFCLIHPS